MNKTVLLSLGQTRLAISEWKKDYNEVRLHSAIAYDVPIALHNPGDAASPSA